MKVKEIKALLLCLVIALFGLTPVALRGQEVISTISNIAKSDPLIITGAIGTSNTYYNSSGMRMGSPLSTSFYADLNFNVYGINMPFTFYYTGDNSSFTYPQFHFSISPQYKGWKLLIGQKSMNFSQYVFSIPFNGVGIEYSKSKGHSFRFGAFYGNLKKAYNGEVDGPSGLNPQYRRTGYGLKVGYGSSKNFLDIYIFRAKDHLSSIDEVWYDKISAKENLAVGLKGRLSLGRHFNLSANFASSLLTSDIRTERVDPGMIEGTAKDIDNIFNIRYSSQVRWAGDAMVNTSWRYFNGSLSYRIVQPDYNSLGVSYITSNYHALTASGSTHIGTVSLAASFSGQSDNLSGQQLFTTKGFVYNASASTNLGQFFTISGAYNGYLQRQYDGAAKVAEETRVNRRTDSWTLSPSSNFITNSLQHSISLSGNYSTNLDLNPFATGESDVKTLAAGLGYNLTVEPIETTFSFNINSQNSKGYNTQYNTNIYSFSTSRSFLEERNLSLGLTMSLTSNKVKEQNRNLSLGGSLSAGYTLKEVHTFSLSGSYNRYASTNLVTDASSRWSNNLTISMSYNYTFTLLHIRRKAEEGQPRITSDFMRKAHKDALQQQTEREKDTRKKTPKRY